MLLKKCLICVRFLKTEHYLLLIIRFKSILTAKYDFCPPKNYTRIRELTSNIQAGKSK